MSVCMCTAPHIHSRLTIFWAIMDDSFEMKRQAVVGFVQACGGNMVWHNKHAMAYIWAVC